MRCSTACDLSIRQKSAEACPMQARRWVFRIGMPPQVRIALVEAMADIEHRLAFGTSERLQLGSLVAAFATAREALVGAAQ